MRLDAIDWTIANIRNINRGAGKERLKNSKKEEKHAIDDTSLSYMPNILFPNISDILERRGGGTQCPLASYKY